MGINVIGGATSTTQDKTAIYGTPGTYTFTPPAGTSASNPLLCEVTVVGAGGGGGNYNTSTSISGSGGGAGQVINQSSFYVTGPTTVTVGAGGAAGVAGGNSSFGTLVALGGAAGAAVNTATDKRAGTDDCTKGAAGASALRLLGIGLGGTSSQIFLKDPSTLSTPNGHTAISKPPLTSPGGEWSVATNGSHIIACNTYANGTGNGGNLTAFYIAGSGWTVRSVGSFSSAYYSVTTIGGTAVCFPGGQADTSTYYYATNGSNNWTTSNHGHSGGTGYSWTINLTAEQSELFVIRQQSNVLRRTVDGVNWTNYTLPAVPSGGIYNGVGAIARLVSQSTYVYYAATYVSNNNNVYTSTDLVNWTNRTTNTIGGGNPNAGNYGDYGIIAAGSSLYWMAGGNNDSAYANWFYSSNGYTWTGWSWNTDVRPPSGSINNWGFVKGGVWYASNYSSSSNNYAAVRYGTFFPTALWQASELSQNADYGAIVEYSLPGTSNNAPTAFPGITDLQPTGGSSGVPSTGGDGGNGGSYIAPTSKSTAASAAATPGQVPGSGGGGGGAGSTAGAAGAAGIVSIEYYG